MMVVREHGKVNQISLIRTLTVQLPTFTGDVTVHVLDATGKYNVYNENTSAITKRDGFYIDDDRL